MMGEADHTTKDAEVSTIMHTAIITTDMIPEPAEAEIAVRRYTGRNQYEEDCNQPEPRPPVSGSQPTSQQDRRDEQPEPCLLYTSQNDKLC